MPDPTPHLERFDSYQQACREFRLQIPRTFNLAGAICRRHSDATTRIALREVKPGGINTYTFGGLDFLSDKLAMSLAGSGLARGDKVLVMLPPSSAAAVAHLGALKAGGVVIPISPSAEPSLVSQVFAESGAKFVVILEALLDALLSRAFALPAADALYIVRDLRPSSARLDTKDFWTEVDSASSDFNAIDTESHRPAFLFYDVRGDEVVCLAHSHGSLVSQLAAFEMVSDLDLDPGSTWFTGQDWDSVTSVLAFLYPAWWYGCSVVVAAPPGDLFTLIERCQITHAFVGAEDPQRIVQDRTSDVRRSSLRLIVTDAPASDIARDRDDRPLNVSRFYARPETGVIASSCAPWYSVTSGSPGRLIPGRRIEIVDNEGCGLPHSESGKIAIHTSDPGLSLRYREMATLDRAVSKDWFLTGAFGSQSEDGSLFLVGDQRLM